MGERHSLNDLSQSTRKKRRGTRLPKESKTYDKGDLAAVPPTRGKVGGTVNLWETRKKEREKVRCT